MTKERNVSETRWTRGPWQLAKGDLYDHSDDGDKNGFTVLMAGSRLQYPEDSGGRERRRDRIGPRNFSIHQIRIGEDTWPDDAGYEEAAANAALISAAPELFEALQAVERLAGYCPCCGEMRGRPHAPKCQLSAALTKARGGDEA